MEKKLTVAIGMATIFCVVIGFNSRARTDGKSGLVRISQEEKDSTQVSNFLSGEFCEIFNDNGIPYHQYADFDSGMGLAVYMDPTQCVSNPYPFQITDVHFTLFGPLPSDWVWPVDVQVSIRDISAGDKCNGPDSVLCSETFNVPIDSGYPNMMNLLLSQPCCVTGPFFVELMYQSHKDASTLPSLVMDDTVATALDTCDNWFLHTDGYHSWVDFWGSPPPGDAIIRATGYVNVEECDSSWYFKPDTTHAPSGMPDFGQYQFGDSTALCGPAAVANCLWWFDAVPEEMDPPDFIRLLSDYFHTDPDSGTYVDSIQTGLDRYFGDHGFSLQEMTFVKPDFYEMEDSLKRCQDIILLLGFWQLNGDWDRVGGHFVTMAGVCSESVKVAFSDPGRDAAEGGWPGRVRPPGEHPSHPVGDTLHNAPEYVSQDMYWALVESHAAGNWRLVEYQDFEEIEPFEGQNFQPGQDSVSYDPGKPIHTWVEYAIMICPKPSAVEGQEEGALTPKEFELYQNYPNPFNNETIIKFNLRKSAEVTLVVYNILGQKVRRLVKGCHDPGPQIVGWDGKDEEGNKLSSGIYFYQLKVGEMKETKRLVLLK